MSRLRIDVGYVDRLPLFGVSRLHSVELCGVRALDVLVLSREDVIAGKLSALVFRAAAMAFSMAASFSLVVRFPVRV